MNILNPEQLCFERTEHGFLSLKLNDGMSYDSVTCCPLFPLSQPDIFIAISTREGSQSREIGIIRALKQLPARQRSLVEQEIQFSYFSPTILDIHKITSKYGVDQWEVVTDRGEKTFIVQDVKENVSVRENGLIVITDIEKCRYQIRDYRNLPHKAQMELERTLL